jgi:hypothetical protein
MARPTPAPVGSSGLHREWEPIAAKQRRRARKRETRNEDGLFPRSPVSFGMAADVSTGERLRLAPEGNFSGRSKIVLDSSSGAVLSWEVMP